MRKPGQQWHIPQPELPDGLGDPLSPYFLTSEAAVYLRFKTARLFREWAIRNRVPVLHRGRTLLYDRRVLDAFVQQRSWTLKHKP